MAGCLAIGVLMVILTEVDEEEIRASLPQLDGVVTEGIAVIDDVEVARRFGDAPEQSAWRWSWWRSAPWWGHRCATTPTR